MKLIRYGEPNQERPGLLDNFGKLRDLSQVIPDLGGEYLQPDSIQRLRELDVSGLPMSMVIRLIAPLLIKFAK